MTDPTLFDDSLKPSLPPATDEHAGRTRTADHETSIAGAHSVAFRAGSQKAKLLTEYGKAADYYEQYGAIAVDKQGMTDEEAADQAGLTRSCFWKRCGELRADGLIEPTGGTREGEAGVPRIVCRITDKGREVLA